MAIKLMYLGADPELFLKLKSTGQPVSAHGLIPGTKKNPHPVKDGAIQVDGMAAEFNIDPASTEDQFVANIKSVMGQLGMMLPDHELVTEPCVTFSEEVWDKVPDDSKILGCEPDFNAYTGEENRPPNPEVDFRTAAGHLHFGWVDMADGGVDPKDLGHMQACCILAKELDYHLALPSTFIDKGEAAAKRRELYGSPGAFRPKPYGMEYRVLSNWWLKEEAYMRWVYQTCHRVFSNLLQAKHNHQKLSELVKTALTTNHEYNLKELIDLKSKLDFPPGWEKIYFEGKRSPFDEAYYFFGSGNNTNSTIYF